MAVVVLLSMVDAGVRFPGSAMFEPFAEPDGLDYSAPPVGGFSPLRPDFVRAVLGHHSAFGEFTRPFAQAPAGGVDLGDLGPQIVEHALTNDALADAYPISRLPFSARSDSGGATSDGPRGCSALAGRTVWYRYRAPVSGAFVARVETSTPVALAAYTRESLDSGGALVCDSDPQGQSRIAFTGITRTTYLFQLTSQIGGPFTFSLEKAGGASGVSALPDGTFAGAETDWGYPQISSDGRYVVFLSASPDLDPRCATRRNGVSPCGPQVYVRDLVAGKTELASLTSRGDVPSARAFDPSISGNGRFVTWSTIADDVTDDPDEPDPAPEQDLFLRDLVRDTTERITMAEDGSELNGGVGRLSESGRYVTFQADWEHRPNTFSGQPQTEDVFWKDRRTGRLLRASESNQGVPGNHDSLAGQISPDGRFVIFMSRASNLTAGVGPIDENVNRSGILNFRVYTYDTKNDLLSLECVAEDGAAPNDACVSADISRGGRYSTFWSQATNLKSPNPLPYAASPFATLYRRDRRTGHLEVVTVTNTGEERSERWERNVPFLASAKRILGSTLSSDGSIVAFETDLQLIAGDINGLPDVYVRDFSTDRTIRVSEPASGSDSNGDSRWAAISGDGSVATFFSSASNLVAGDTNGAWDVYVRAWAS